MKKIFTIILGAAGIIGSASAQSNYQKSIAYNGNKKTIDVYRQPTIVVNTKNIHNNDANLFYTEKKTKLANINRAFDQKIFFVKNNRHLDGRQKAKQIRVLQNQRKNEISKVEFQYAKSIHKTKRKTPGFGSHKW